MTTLDRLAPWDGASPSTPPSPASRPSIHHQHQRLHSPRERADALAFLAFAYVSILLLILSARWFDHAPPGSAARRAAGLAVFLLMSSLVAGCLWKTTGELSLPFKAFFFFLAAAPPVAAYIYTVFVLGEDGA